MTAAERQARYARRQRDAGRHRWAIWVTEEERAALDVALARIRDGEAMARMVAQHHGIEYEGVPVAEASAKRT